MNGTRLMRYSQATFELVTSDANRRFVVHGERSKMLKFSIGMLAAVALLVINLVAVNAVVNNKTPVPTGVTRTFVVNGNPESPVQVGSGVS